MGNYLFYFFFSWNILFFLIELFTMKSSVLHIMTFVKITEFDRSLCERLRTHKVFQKDQCFNLNYHKFSIKSYVLDVHPQHMILWRNIENYPFLSF